MSKHSPTLPPLWTPETSDQWVADAMAELRHAHTLGKQRDEDAIRIQIVLLTLAFGAGSFVIDEWLLGTH